MLIDDLFDRALLDSALAASSDPRTPGAEEMHDIVRRTLRIAVVGISRDPTKDARRVPSYLATRGADILPVNPNADRILGRDAKASLDDVEQEVDMVLVFRPSDEAGEVVRQAMRRPENPVVWLQEGIRNDEAAEEARDSGLTVVQDLCLYKVHRALGDSLRRTGQPPL